MAQDPEEMMEEGGEEQPQPSSKSKLSLKTLILIGLPLVMVQGVLAYFVVKQYVEPKMPETKPRPEEVQEQDVRNEEVEDLSTYVPHMVEDVIVNPAETGGQRYLSVSFTIYVPQQYGEVIGDLDDEFRSVVIERIGRKRMDELDDFKDQQILREEIKDDINSVIARYFSKKYPDLIVPRVVFSKYIIQ
jgi:flagellar basal body-associated protein FliL